MKPLAALGKGFVTVAFPAAAAVVLLSLPSAASHRRGLGSIRNSGTFEHRIEYEDRDALRLQREAIAAQEEARREQGREKRRDEIEEALDKAGDEYLASQEEIRSTSWAARRAPRGVYYRLPGTVLSSLPAGYETVSVGKREYFYSGGIFFGTSPQGFWVMTAPVGAAVSSLPDGTMPVEAGDRDVHYYFGSYFAEAEGGYAVVAPEPGFVVPYLPDGYTTEHVEGALQYVFGGVSYRPVYRQGLLVYLVTR